MAQSKSPNVKMTNVLLYFKGQIIDAENYKNSKAHWHGMLKEK